jgi:DNA polymerase-3 subunit epsilon
VTDPVVVIDFETTGLSPDWGARTTEVAALILEGGVVTHRFQSLMNAGVPVPPFIQNLTGITPAMVRNAPPASEVMRELRRFIGDLPLVAHNASFDRKFLDAELERLRLKRKQEIICSMRVARRVYPAAPNHQLATLVSFLGLKTAGRYHRALADAEMTAQLWTRVTRDLSHRFALRSVPVEFLMATQFVPTRGLADYVRRHRGRFDL